jgi:hypothetical protein
VSYQLAILFRDMITAAAYPYRLKEDGPIVVWAWVTDLWGSGAYAVDLKLSDGTFILARDCELPIKVRP